MAVQSAAAPKTPVAGAQFSVMAPEFANGLSLALRIIDAQAVLPVLKCVLIEVDDDEDAIRLTASDLENAVRVRVPADCARKGVLAIDAGLMQRIASEMPEGEIEARVEDSTLILDYDNTPDEALPSRYHARLSTWNHEEFPQWVIPENTKVTRLTLTYGKLRELVERTLWAVPTRDPRKVLLGALWQFRIEEGDSWLEIAATDGKTMAWVRHDMKFEQNFKTAKPTDYIIPHKALDMLASAMGKDAQDVKVEITLTERTAHFTAAETGFELRTNLIGGTYPNHRLVMEPAFKNERHVQANLKDLTGALKRMGKVIADTAHKSVQMEFDATELKISGQVFGEASGEETLDLITTDIVEKYQMGINPAFVLRMLKTWQGDVVNMAMGAKPVNPVLFTAPDDDNFIGLVMPVKITDEDIE